MSVPLYAKPVIGGSLHIEDAAAVYFVAIKPARKWPPRRAQVVCDVRYGDKPTDRLHFFAGDTLKISFDVKVDR